MRGLEIKGLMQDERIRWISDELIRWMRNSNAMFYLIMGIVIPLFPVLIWCIPDDQSGEDSQTEKCSSDNHAAIEYEVPLASSRSGQRESQVLPRKRRASNLSYWKFAMIVAIFSSSIGCLLAAHNCLIASESQAAHARLEASSESMHHFDLDRSSRHAFLQKSIARTIDDIMDSLRAMNAAIRDALTIPKDSWLSKLLRGQASVSVGGKVAIGLGFVAIIAVLLIRMPDE